MDENELKKSLEEEILDTKEKLVDVISRINKYDIGSKSEKAKIGKDEYRAYINTRDNLSIQLNYYQNQVLIEQNQEIIKYLKEQKK